MRRPDVAHGDADSGQLTPRSTFYDTGRFGRLFPALPPFSADVPLIRDAPGVSPYLYDQNVDGGRTTFLTEEIPESAAVSIDGNARRDLPRNGQSVALIADPRNDENMVVCGLQHAMLRFHNQVYLDVAADLGATYTLDEKFAETQRVVRWHYQWMVLHEFLPRTVGQTTAQDVLENGLKFFDWRNNPYIPVEFSVGAYRF